MSLPTLDEMIDEIIRNKILLAKTIKRNLSLGVLDICDVPFECQYCGIPKSHIRFFSFNTFMGILRIRVCDECYKQLSKEAEAEQKTEAIRLESDRLAERIKIARESGINP